MAGKLGDPMEGVWRWVFRRLVRPHWLGAIVSLLVAPSLTALLYAHFTKGRVGAGLAAAGITFGAMIVLFILYAVLVAPYEQRSALRKDVTSLKSEIVEKDKEIASFRTKRLDADHEEGIKETLRSVEQRIIKSETVGIGSVEMSSLIGHVPTVVPLIEDWNQKSSLNTYVGKSLEARSEKAIAEFDYHVYSHDALRDIVGFAMHKTSTPGFGPPYPIEWAPIIQAVPDEIRLVGRTQGFVARVNNDVTREQAMERVQLFLDDVLSWKEVALYGDIPRNEALRVSRERLLEELRGLLAKHGYLVGSGCSRCANGPLVALS